MEVAVFSELYDECRDLLSVDKVLVVSGSLVFDDYRGTLSVRADRVFPFEQAREAYAERLSLCVRSAQCDTAGGPEALVTSLRELMEPFRGGRCGVVVEYRNGSATAAIRFGPEWRLRPGDVLIKRLRDLLGPDGVRIAYGRGAGQSSAGQAATG
jgi:DNA polymerase-3 subunit alpha